MSNTNNIREQFNNRKKFRLKIPNHDGGKRIFWPEYRHAQVRVMYDDLVAVLLDKQVEIGLVQTVIGDLIGIRMITRHNDITPRTNIKIHRNKVIALLHPE